MNLRPRLKAVADQVRYGVRVADVGTDHAYLPAFLVESGQVVSAIASDIGEGPLNNARATVTQRRLQDKIQLRLCDGLDGIASYEVDDVCICGMGGEMIASIIDRAKWLFDPQKSLVLQPMTAVDDLRVYLADNGFKIISESIIKDSNRLYIVIRTTFTGESFAYTEDYPYIGTVNVSDDNAFAYFQRQLKRLNKQINMLKNSGHNPDEVTRLSRIYNLISEKME